MGHPAEQFEELMRRAEEDWEVEARRSGVVGVVYETARRSADKAFKAHAYHQALEFARAAEALAHVKQHGPHRLERGGKSLRLDGRIRQQL